jgi:VanZ family protein
MHHLIKTLTLFIKPALWLCIIVTLCLMPPQDIPGKSLMRVPHFDKMVHAGMYFVLALLIIRPFKTFRIPVWTGTLAFSLFIGGIIEILQWAVTSERSASWGDFSADMAGALAGLLIYGWLVAGRKWERYL